MLIPRVFYSCMCLLMTQYLPYLGMISALLVLILVHSPVQLDVLPQKVRSAATCYSSCSSRPANVQQSVGTNSPREHENMYSVHMRLTYSCSKLLSKCVLTTYVIWLRRAHMSTAAHADSHTCTGRIHSYAKSLLNMHHTCSLAVCVPECQQSYHKVSLYRTQAQVGAR